MSTQTESRQALQELIALLQEVDQRWTGEEWNLHSAADAAGAYRALMHMLEGGLLGNFEQNAAHPHFRKIVTPTRKYTGDNPDAIYSDTVISPAHRYRVRGCMAGATYVSLTVETGTEDGTLAPHTAGLINDEQFDVDKDGNFEILVGGPRQKRNWLELVPEASRITTRHYFEDSRFYFENNTAAQAANQGLLNIETLDPPGTPPPPPADASIAAGIRRVAQFVRSRTLGMPPLPQDKQPAFVSTTPNEFRPPTPPGSLGASAIDAHYSMAPYLLGEEEALVITARWPRCRYANVCLWTRFLQTYDYVNRRSSLNRKQTVLGKDGSFQVVIASRDPGVPNWLDTEGRPVGIVYWRYMLAEGKIETPQAKVVPLHTLKPTP